PHRIMVSIPLTFQVWINSVLWFASSLNSNWCVNSKMILDKIILDNKKLLLGTIDNTFGLKGLFLPFITIVNCNSVPTINSPFASGITVFQFLYRLKSETTLKRVSGSASTTFDIE